MISLLSFIDKICHVKTETVSIPDSLIVPQKRHAQNHEHATKGSHTLNQRRKCWLGRAKCDATNTTQKSFMMKQDLEKGAWP